MTFTAPTYDEAVKLAADFRKAFAGMDWTVCICAPLFEGDLYYVVIS